MLPKTFNLLCELHVEGGIVTWSMQRCLESYGEFVQRSSGPLSPQLMEAAQNDSFVTEETYYEKKGGN